MHGAASQPFNKLAELCLAIQILAKVAISRNGSLHLVNQFSVTSIDALFLLAVFVFLVNVYKKTVL